MPCAVEGKCYVRIPLSLINVVALALAVAAGYFANEGVSPGFVGFLEEHQCCLFRHDGHCTASSYNNTWINPMHAAMWMFFVLCALIAIVPWARLHDFDEWCSKSGESGESSRALAVMGMFIGGAYCVAVWLAFNVTFWRTMHYKCSEPFEGHMYRKLFD